MPITNGNGNSSAPLAYLGVFNAVNFDLTNLAVVAAWDYPPDLLIGSDISLSADGLTFTIESEGWYEFALQGFFLCPDATTKGVGVADIAVTPNGASPVWDAAVMPNSVWAYVNGAVMGENSGSVTCPATHLPAGSTFQVRAYYNLGASGAPMKFSGTFLVIRVA